MLANGEIVASIFFGSLLICGLARADFDKYLGEIVRGLLQQMIIKVYPIFFTYPALIVSLATLLRLWDFKITDRCFNESAAIPMAGFTTLIIIKLF